jgi:hypothetical protein
MPKKKRRPPRRQRQPPRRPPRPLVIVAVAAGWSLLLACALLVPIQRVSFNGTDAQIHIRDSFVERMTPPSPSGDTLLIHDAYFILPLPEVLMVAVLLVGSVALLTFVTLRLRRFLRGPRAKN